MVGHGAHVGRLSIARNRARVSNPWAVDLLYIPFMRDDYFQAVDDLIRRAERAAAATPDQVRLLAELIRMTGNQGADPYLLIGVLLEGAVHTIAEHIPRERQGDTTEQLGRLLVERLRAHGLA
jgi:hypothetical protein